MVRVSGTITNNDTVTWSTINVYAFISDEPDDDARAARRGSGHARGRRGRRPDHRRAAQGLHRELAPGDHATYSLSIPRRLLHADTPGVYWFGVHALGEGPEGRDLAADGRARTFLPLVPAARVGQQPTAVVIPLRHQLVYTDEGSLDDLAGWTQSLSQGGRLRSLVDFGASSGDRTVTWAVDPALIDAVRRLADGNPPRSLAPNLQAGRGRRRGRGVRRPVCERHPDRGAQRDPDGGAGGASRRQPARPRRARPGRAGGRQAAQAWLARLGEAMRPEDQVMSLPYGDVDVAAAADARPAALRARGGPGRHDRCRASTSPPPRCCPRRAAT